MKTITIKTQKEFDALPYSFEEYTEVCIKSNAGFWLLVNRKIGNTRVEAWGSSHVEAWGSSHVVALGSSHVVARGSSHVEAWGSSHVEAWGSSHVVARESSHVVAWGSSHVVALGSSHVVALGSSHVVALGSSHVVARESSHVVALGSSHVVARESSHVVARESSHVVAWGSSHIEAAMNASVKVQNTRVVIERITQQAIAICLEQCEVMEKDYTAQVIVCPRVLYDKETFLDIYREQVDGDYIILYKSVNPDTLCDFYTGKIKYEGMVTCPDFDPNNDRECGGGLHLSPKPHLALSYNQGNVLKCKVHKDDFVVFPHNISKVRCSKVEVVGVVG